MMESFLIYDITQGIGTYTNNIVYVYIFGCVAFLNYSKFSKAQKIVLIYLSTIAMRIFVPTRTVFTISIMTITIFLVEEYMNPDQEKMRIVHSWKAKLIDFAYSFIFIDAGLWMMLILFVLSGKGRNCLERILEPQITTWVIYIGVFILAWVTMHSVVAPTFVVKEFKDINSYFAQYIERDLNLDDDEVRTRLQLLTELEDKSYFVRENSYNWISLEFLKYKIGVESRKRESREKRTHIKKIINFIRTYGIKVGFRILKEKIHIGRYEVIHWSKSIMRRIRGGATLEMQLIRQISIEEGYRCVVRRKVFEFVATFVFFSQLKRYYERYDVEKRKYFKEFLLYVYLQSVPVKINGIRFRSIAYLMETVNKIDDEQVLHIEDYNISELYVAYLALTGAPVSDKRLILYPNVVEEYGIDLNYAKWFSKMIAGRKIRPGERKTHDELETLYQEYEKRRTPGECFYKLGHTIIPIVEDNIYYGEPRWPSYGYRECWSFAQTVYTNIWWQVFNSYAGTSDDLLRNIPRGDERRITAENAKRFLLQTEPGAVIRIGDTIQGKDNVGNKYHSQILLEKCKTGVVLYESNSYKTSIEFYTWEMYEDIYGKYLYFKYIKFPGAYKATNE